MAKKSRPASHVWPKEIYERDARVTFESSGTAYVSWYMKGSNGMLTRKSKVLKLPGPMLEALKNHRRACRDEFRQELFDATQTVRHVLGF